MTPKELFLKYKINLREVIISLRKSPESKYLDRPESSIRSFLSQTMNGARNLPEDLKLSILAVFKQKHKDLNEAEVSREIEEAFNEVLATRKKIYLENKRIERVGKLPDVDVAKKNDYELLRKCASKAKTVTIITAEPAEVKNNSLADQLKHDLLEKVGILKNPSNQQAKYTFYLAEGLRPNKIPIEFWSGLYRYALKERVEHIDEKFIEANKTFLKTFVVPDDEIDVTHGIIDENLDTEISFITVYNQIIRKDVFEEINVIREEKENLYRVIRRLDKIKKLQPKEFGFEQALPIIIRQQ